MNICTTLVPYIYVLLIEIIQIYYFHTFMFILNLLDILRNVYLKIKPSERRNEKTFSQFFQEKLLKLISHFQCKK